MREDYHIYYENEEELSVWQPRNNPMQGQPAWGIFMQSFSEHENQEA